MAYSLQKHEQEAQSLQNQALATIYDIAKGKSKYRKQFIAYEKIERANKPTNPTAVTSVVGGHGVNLVSVIAQKLRRKRKEFIANLNYIATITGKKRRQNINIINQINGTAFKVTSHKKYKNYRNCYVFKHLEKTVNIIEESKVQNFAQLESLQTLDSSHKQGYYKNNNTESIDLGSKFLENVSEEKPQVKNIEYKTTKSQIVELPKEPVKPVKFKKRPSNKRKKATNAERKARIYHFNQYETPQNLSYHYPLTQEDCYRLQNISGRNFDLNAMNELLLDMSKRLDNRFCSKAQFLAYFGKCLRYEMRDSVKINNSNFRIKSNHTDGAELLQLNRQKQVERYLAEVEQKAITQVSPENQLRARLANTLETLKSYELLSRLKDFKVIGNTIRLHLREAVELSNHDQSVVLSQVQSIYSASEIVIEQVEYVIENPTQITSRESVLRTKGTMDIPRLAQGLWGNVCRRLIEIYGIHVYNNWFSKLTAIVDEQNRIIELKSPNMFTRQWIETNYGETIKEITATLKMEVRLC